MCMCMCLFMYVWIYVCVCVCMRLFMYVWMCECVCVCVCARVRVCVCMCTYWPPLSLLIYRSLLLTLDSAKVIDLGYPTQLAPSACIPFIMDSELMPHSGSAVHRYFRSPHSVQRPGSSTRDHLMLYPNGTECIRLISG